MGRGLVRISSAASELQKIFESDIDKIEHMFYTCHCRVLHQEETDG